MNILITGATGFVGRNLVAALALTEHKVFCAVTKKEERLKAEQIIVGRLESQPDWRPALKNIDIVIHLAARVHVMKDTEQAPLDVFCQINSVATKHLAEQAAESGVKRFVYLSSIKVNGEFTIQGFPFTEESLAQPEDPYGKSKLYAEQYLQAVSAASSMEFVILRPPLVYGPEVRANFFKMLGWVNKGWPLPFNKIHNRRSLVYIDNLVSALCTVAVAPAAANQIYLVADDTAWSLSDLLRILAREMGIKLRLFSIPGRFFILNLFRLNNIRQRLFGSLEVSADKLKTQLEWVPPVDPIQGLSKTAKWYKNEYGC